MAEEDKLKEFAEGLGGILAPSSQVNDPAKMLAAIQNAALLRAGIGLLGRTRMGENEYDKASRVLKDVSTDAATQVKALATAGTTAAAKQAKVSSEFGKAQTAYSKLFYVPDEFTGALKQLRQDFMEEGISPPTQEFFKNNLFTQDYFLGNTGQGDNYIEFHKGQVKRAKGAGEEAPTWDETFNTYSILRNT